MTDGNAIIAITYDVVAVLGIAIIIYVMQKVEHDRLSKIDHRYVHNFRRLAFTASALALCYSVISDEWQRSLPILLLVSAGVLNLAVNAVSLHMRVPPGPGSRIRSHAPLRGSYVMSKLEAFVTYLFR